MKRLALSAAILMALSSAPAHADHAHVDYGGEPPVRLNAYEKQVWVGQLADGKHVPFHVRPWRRGLVPVLVTDCAATRVVVVTKCKSARGRNAHAAPAIEVGARSPARAARRAVAPEYLPVVVTYRTKCKPGTVVIDTRTRYLYFVLKGGKARRYGIGVGREGFSWVGTVRVGRKAEWPDWRPPAEMRKRQPHLPTFMEGGPHNPLGARAIYLYKGGRDTMFRIHGSNEPWTIGHAVSSGCIRMRNEDVTDLYGRVGVGTQVVVL